MLKIYKRLLLDVIHETVVKNIAVDLMDTMIYFICTKHIYTLDTTGVQ